MTLLLQILGGSLFLLNKVFLWLSERYPNKSILWRRWRIASWTVYLLGLPAWVILFIDKRNWIAASMEAAGAPSMVLGLVLALRGTTKDPPRWLNWVALASIPLGLGYSLYDFGGLTTTTQLWEIGLLLGFLVGTYQLAKEQPSGYLWYILMHVSCGRLMWMQGFPWLCAQQVVSIGFIIDAYRLTWKKP